MKLLTPILFIAGAIVAFYFFVNPTWKEIKTLKAATVQYQAALARVKTSQDKYSQLVSRYNSITDGDIKRLQAIIPDHVDDVKLAVDINAISEKYGSSIKNIKIESDNNQKDSSTAGVSSSTYNTTSMSFGTSMTYENFLRFLADLQQSLHLADVSSVEFKPGDTSIYDYTVNVKTYWLR